jgi:predicted MFS family arabinose efflux permease
MLSPVIHLYKNAYSGLSRSTWWLSIVMFINRSGTMVVPFMTMYLTQHMGVGIGKAGIVMSLFGAGSVIGALLGGKITDKIGYYPVQLFTLAGGGILFIVLGQMQSFTAICIASFVLSMVNEAFRPANAVAIAHYSRDENRTRSYSLNRLAINLGWAFGAALGGIIAAYNYQLLFWVDGITNISAAFLLYFVLSPSKNNAAPLQKVASTLPVTSAYKDYPFIIFICLQVVFAICFFQLFTILPVYYKTQLHLSESFIGINMAFNGLLIVLIEMVIIFHLEGKRPHLYYIIIGVLLVGFSFMLLNILTTGAATIAYAMMFTVTMGEIFSMPFMNSYWIARTSNNNRGQYAALFTVAWSVAQIIGPFTGGQLVEQFSYRLLWWVTAAACAVLSLGYLLLLKSTKKA